MDRYDVLQGRGERYDGTSCRMGRFATKEMEKHLKDTAKNRTKIKKYINGDDALGRRCLLSAAFAQPRPVSSISLGRFSSA